MILLTALIFFLCIAMFVYALLNSSAERHATLEHRLQLSTGVAVAGQSLGSAGGGRPALRTNRMGGSGALSRALGSAGSMQKLGAQLERAGWRVSVTEFLVLSLVTGIVAGLAGSMYMPALTFPAAGVGMLLPLLLMLRSIGSRRKKFVNQLVETLPLLANSMKAGVSLLQAIDQATTQLKPPISAELRRVLRDIQVGATPDDAFQALNERIKSNDMDLVINAIQVQRSTGGNLAEILDKVAYTMRERIRIRGEIKTLTAQQQISGYLLAGIPVFLLVAFKLLNPVYMAPLFDTGIGHWVLGIAGAMQLVAFFIVRRIVNIEV